MNSFLFFNFEVINKIIEMMCEYNLLNFIT
jgi:hypothetical protein